MKKVLVSSALAAALALPAMAFTVYDNDDTKVDLYGSIRGYVGVGSTLDNRDLYDTGYMLGIQNNSQFGVKFSKDKFKANVEFGAVEPDVAGKDSGTGHRQFWGSYDTGAGTFLFGKTNTPTIDDGFITNWLNHDNGLMGFGGIATGKRLIQLQYQIAGLNVALVEDKTGYGRVGGNQESPRIALSYTIKNEAGKPFVKVAASYKYYNSATIEAGVPAGTSAYHVWVGIKPTFGGSYLSVLAHYGKNGHLYGEQSTRYSKGGYLLDKLDSAIGLDAQRTGATMEFGTKMSEDITFIVGAGYQATFGGKGQKDKVLQDGGLSSFKDSFLHSYATYVSLPYKLSKNFTFTPQVTYYHTFEGTSGKGSVMEHRDEKGIVGGARIRWDF